jgi:cobalt-zinc-cadmium efflux system protein
MSTAARQGQDPGGDRPTGGNGPAGGGPAGSDGPARDTATGGDGSASDTATGSDGSASDTATGSDGPADGDGKTAGHRHGIAATAAGQHRRALVTVLVITAAVGLAEVAGALLTGSLVLFADAAHMTADVAGIALSLLAVQFAARPATTRRTFGYARAEILAALANALLLLCMAAVIAVAAIRRLVTPTQVAPAPLAVLGVIALAANAVSLVVLRRGQAESLNLRGAYLEVASDALGGLAVVTTSIVIAVTGFARFDPIASLIVGALILPRTWRLLREAVDVLLEASPRGIDLSEVRRHMTEVSGVREVHELHAWMITSGLPVLTAHVVVDPEVLADGRSAGLLDRLQDCVRGHFDVAHSTFQLELAGHADHERPMHG